jgi:predicted RNA-binding protein with PIN domain
MKKMRMDSAREIFIIDGYNLLLRGFPHLAGADLQSARESLQVRLREFRKVLGPGTRFILVYDGAEELAAAFAPRGADPEIEIIFSMPPHTADDAVIEMSRKLQGTAPLTVVTSDEKDIARRVRGLRLRHRTSEEFAEIIDETMSRSRSPRSGEPGPPPAPVSEKPSPEEVSPEDVEEWMRIFSQPKPPRENPPGGGPGKTRGSQG